MKASGVTVVAAAIVGAILLLPARPRLSHLDFVAGGPDALQLCSARNPQFLPVVSRSAPVTLEVASSGGAGYRLVLRTSTGKTVRPGDLLPTGGRLLNLYAISPGLDDLQVPEVSYGPERDVWHFDLTPRRPGAYRLFADFTPLALGQEMYVSSDLGAGVPPLADGEPDSAPRPSAPAVSGVHLGLRATPSLIHLRQPVALTLTVDSRPGSGEGLRPDAGVGASLIAFDPDRTGMVCLRLSPPAPGAPAVLSAPAVSFPDSGRYVVWARVRTGEGATQVPFAIDVQP